MLSMVREVVFGVGFALLLPRFFGLDGVLYSMPVSDVLTFVIAAGMIVKNVSGTQYGRSNCIMNHIITISREFGSGGRTVGQKR